MDFGRLPLVALFLLMTAMGCSRQDTHERYTPNSDAARRAVESAMQAWLDGRPAGPLEGFEPSTTVVDTHRTPGQILEEFEVLGEVPSQAYRCFAVRVSYSNPAGEERLRYCVIGIDPLWVFRLEDYDMIAHWDHKMAPPEEELKPVDADRQPDPEITTETETATTLPESTE